MTKEVEQQLEQKNITELDSVIPAMNIGLPIQQPIQETSNLVSDESLMDIYEEVLRNLREDRQEINELLTNFKEMVINEGDSTTSSKEALVNLIKIKSDSADKITRIADLMTRIKLKDRDTFPRYLAASQNNTININGQTKRELLKQIEKTSKKEQEQ